MLAVAMFVIGLSMGAVLREGITLLKRCEKEEEHRAGGRWEKRHPVTAWLNGEEASEDEFWLQSRL